MKRIISLMVTAALVLCALPALAETWMPQMGAHQDVIAMLEGTTSADAAKGFTALARRHGVDDPDTLPGMKAQVGYTEIVVVFDGELRPYLTLAEFIALVESNSREISGGDGTLIFTGDIIRITSDGAATYYFYTGVSGKRWEGDIENYPRRAVPGTILVHQQETPDGLSPGDLYKNSAGAVRLVVQYRSGDLGSVYLGDTSTKTYLFVYPDP